MNQHLIYEVARNIGFPTLSDGNDFDQDKIAYILKNAQQKNFSLVNQKNIFDLLVDTVKGIPKDEIYNNGFKRAVIGHVRNKIVSLFNL